MEISLTREPPVVSLQRLSVASCWDVHDRLLIASLEWFPYLNSCGTERVEQRPARYTRADAVEVAGRVGYQHNLGKIPNHLRCNLRTAPPIDGLAHAAL
jgi:hypothetical protein